VQDAQFNKFSSFTWQPVGGCTAKYWYNNIPISIMATCCNTDALTSEEITICGQVYPIGTPHSTIVTAVANCTENAVVPPAIGTFVNLGNVTQASEFPADEVLISYTPNDVNVTTPVKVSFPDIAVGNSFIIVYPNASQSYSFDNPVINSVVIENGVGNNVTVTFKRA
jgi:hypothetical protein